MSGERRAVYVVLDTFEHITKVFMISQTKFAITFMLSNTLYLYPLLSPSLSVGGKAFVTYQISTISCAEVNEPQGSVPR